MNRMSRISLFVLLVCLAHEVCAQPYGLVPETGKLLSTGNAFDKAEMRNFWNSGRNAAGLRQDTVTVSYAGVGGEYETGGFRDYWEAESSWSAGAIARTITHLDRISMSGTFSFENFSGEGMCGSMSARPGYYPVDVLEFTPGGKTRQTYSFSGGISADVSPRWRIGGKIEYTGMNYTKRKDLRHTNYLLDMTVTPSAMYHDGDFAMGLAGIFSKNSESIDAEELGISSSAYYAFLDTGLMYGAYESWEGNGVHLSESGIDGFPMRELLYGGALQMQWKSLYAEIEYLYGEGKTGEKQTEWFRFSGHGISANFGYSFRRSGAEHYLRLAADWKRQTNDETVVGKVTEGGVTVTEVYGSNRLYERRLLRLNPEYALVSPAGSVKAGAYIISLARQVSPMYPYVFSRYDIISGVYLSGDVSVGKLDVLAGLCFRMGNAKEESRGNDAQIDVGEPPYRLEEWYALQGEYMTAPRVSAKAGVRYGFLKGLYAEATVMFTRGFNLRYVSGADRWTVAIGLGYVF